MPELFALALALSMDAFAISIVLGARFRESALSLMLKSGLFFGLAQLLMPLLGFYLGKILFKAFEGIYPFIAFMLLLFLGMHMLKEAHLAQEERAYECYPSIWQFTLLALATSMDAMAAGLTLALFSLPMWFCVLSIGCCTFALSSLGVYLGNKMGTYLKEKAQYFGGIVLILIGVKILFEHLNP